MPGVLPVLLLLHALGAAANVTYCWGAGSSGQLGDGQGGGSHSRPLPTPVSNAPEFAAVGAGARHTCGLTAAGQAYCWGQAVDGELGVGDVRGAYLATPAPVAGNLAFTSLSLGDKFTCGIADSKAYCWGSGESGRLGTGGNGSSSVPVEVGGNHSFASVALGQSHACALTREGAAWCWGENYFGQLGDSSTNTSAVPVPVATNRTFAAVVAGAQHTCALLAGSRQPFCWGNNADAQLGSNSTVMATTPVPVAPQADYSFAALAAGAMFTCGNVINSGNVATYCWGKNSRGEIGGEPRFDFPREPVRLPGTQTFVSIGAGKAHACGVDTLAAAYCWGDGTDGQLGTGTQGRVGEFTDYISTTPLPVAPDGGATIPFYSVAAGGRHTCGVSPRAAAAPAPSPGTAAVSPLATPGPPPAAPASPSPAPATRTEAGSTPQQEPTSAPFPVGAVVGAVLGTAAVVALAFFTLRPGKGWMRKRGAAAPAANVESGLKDSSSEMAVGDKGLFTSMPPGVLDSFLPAHGTQQPQAAALPCPPWHPPPGASSQATLNSSGKSEDPVLAYISSYLALRPNSRPASRTRTGVPGSSGSYAGGNASSVGQTLSPEAHMWQLQWDELEIQQQVGRGSFGTVYLASWHETSVAVKVLIDRDCALQSAGLELPDETMRALEAEAAVMIRMRHPNVVQFMGLCQLPPALVTEYCARGSLYDCLRTSRASPSAAADLTWARRLGMAIDAGTGLLYLHSRNIVHRDVKSPNFLVTDHWGVKVSDFNLSRLLGEAGVPALSTGGPSNPVWLAPEVLRGGHASTASDIFSFGVVLWELLTWRLPWSGSGLSPYQIGAKVVAGERLEVPPRQALPGPDTAAFAGLDAYCALLQECWAAQPEQRPGMVQVVRRLRGLLEACRGEAGQAATGCEGEDPLHAVPAC